MSSIAFSTSPRYSGVGRAGSTRTGTAPTSTSMPDDTISPSSSRSRTRSASRSVETSPMPNGLTDHHASPRCEAVVPDVGQRAVRRRAQVDGSLAAARGGRPGGAEELLAGRDQVVRTRSRALRVEDEHVGVVGHQVDEQLHVVHERRGERLHALDRDAGGQPVGELEQLRVGPAQRGRSLADLLGQQQLAARRRPQPLHRLERALVGHREGADLLDVVAPELDAQGVLLGGREDVDDAAAHGELAALLDQVDPRVRRVGEPAHELVERHRVADAQLDRLEVAEALDLRLEDRAHRRHDDLERPVARVGARMPQPPEHGQPPPDGVAARAEPLVRQRLPARVVGDRRRVDQVGRAPRPGPRPRGRWRSRRGPTGPPRPVPAPRTAASPPARSGRARSRPPRRPGHPPGRRPGRARRGLRRRGRRDCTRSAPQRCGHNTSAPFQPRGPPTRGSAGGRGWGGSSLRGAADTPRTAAWASAWLGRPRPGSAGCRTRCPRGRRGRPSRCPGPYVPRWSATWVAPTPSTRSTSSSRLRSRGRRSKCSRFFARSWRRAPR